MSGFLNKRRLLAGTLALMTASAASLLWSQTPPSAPSAAPPATAPMDPNASIAMVNGLPINNAVFYELLIQADGWRMFQQVLDLALAQNACQGAGIAWSGPDFETRKKAEFQRYLDNITVEGTTLTNEDKSKLIAERLRQQGVSNAEFNLRLDRDTCLRALAQGKIDVTPEEIEAFYKSTYGKKVTANIFQVPDTTAVVNLKAAIDKQKVALEDVSIDKQNQILAVAAQSVGLGAPQPAIIPENAPGIDSLKTLAFATPEKTASSMLEFQGKNIVVYVNKKEDSQLAKFTLTTVLPTGGTVTDKLKQQIYTAKESQWMNNRMTDLRLHAAVTVNHPFLKEQYDAWVDAVRKQLAAAAPGAATTAPAMDPTPGSAATPPSPAATPPGTLKEPITLPPASRPR